MDSLVQVVETLEELRRGGDVISGAVRQYSFADPLGRLLATWSGQLVEVRDRGIRPWTLYAVAFDSGFEFSMFDVYGVGGEWLSNYGPRTYQVHVGDVSFDLRAREDYERHAEVAADV